VLSPYLLRSHDVFRQVMTIGIEALWLIIFFDADSTVKQLRTCIVVTTIRSVLSALLPLSEFASGFVVHVRKYAMIKSLNTCKQRSFWHRRLNHKILVCPKLSIDALKWRIDVLWCNWPHGVLFYLKSKYNSRA
jgi:hypothetical protein